jgi:hypothetical protein
MGREGFGRIGKRSRVHAVLISACYRLAYTHIDPKRPRPCLQPSRCPLQGPVPTQSTVHGKRREGQRIGKRPPAAAPVGVLERAAPCYPLPIGADTPPTRKCATRARPKAVKAKPCGAAKWPALTPAALGGRLVSVRRGTIDGQGSASADGTFCWGFEGILRIGVSAPTNAPQVLRCYPSGTPCSPRNSAPRKSNCIIRVGGTDSAMGRDQARQSIGSRASATGTQRATPPRLGS